MKKLIIYGLMFVFLLSLVSALGISPGTISFNNLTRNSYAESEVLISSVFEMPILLNYETTNIDWIKLEFQSEKVSFGTPVKAKLIVNVPPNIPNGFYDSEIIVYGTPFTFSEGSKSSSLAVAIVLDVKIEIIGDEILTCTVGGIDLKNVEAGYSLDLSVSVKNTGNVNIEPTVFIDIYDQDYINLVSQQQFRLDNILSTKTLNTFESTNINLNLGQYWAEIIIPDCNFKSVKTFEVVEKGAIVDEGELLKIKTINQSIQGVVTPIQAIFKNKGQRTVVAKFKAEILKDGQIVDLIETDEISIKPGDVEIIDSYYLPDLSGNYEIRGRVVYNNKLSFEKEVLFEVISKERKIITSNHNLNWLLLVIIIFIILIISKIIFKKKRRHYKSKKVKK